SLHLEIAGPGGARLVLVARGGRLVAVFPQDRAVFEGAADRRVLGDVTGVALAPADVIDFLTGTAPASVTDYRAEWGPRVPTPVRGRLEDGTRLDVRVRAPELDGKVADAAFDPPPHDGYRPVDA